MVQQPAVGKSFDDDFYTDTVQVAAGDADNWFGLAHIYKDCSKNSDFRTVLLLRFSVKTPDQNVPFTMPVCTTTPFFMKLYDMVVFLSKNSHVCV